MYVPMGGASWRALNIWPIFLFVALWHDVQLRLVGWALLTCSMFVPELVRVNSARKNSAQSVNTLWSTGGQRPCAAACRGCMDAAPAVGSAAVRWAAGNRQYHGVDHGQHGAR